MMQDKSTAYQKSLDRLTDIYSNIVLQADQQSLLRCPYKNVSDECTASFGCRNQRKNVAGGGNRLLCAGDNKLEYRTAWETDPRAVVDAKKRHCRRQSAMQRLTDCPRNR